MVKREGLDNEYFFTLASTISALHKQYCLEELQESTLIRVHMFCGAKVRGPPNLVLEKEPRENERNSITSRERRSSDESDGNFFDHFERM